MNLTPRPENIVTVFDVATSRQLSEGMDWYKVAHDLALEIASGDLHTGAGVIAALSPNKAWTVNANLARAAFVHNKAHGSMGDNVRKADRILAGGNPLDILGGNKVRAFYDNIVNPSGGTVVTIDRHAFDVALNKRSGDNNRPSITNKRYAAWSAAYVDAAASLGILPLEVQAVTWTVWRERWAWRQTAA